MIVVHDFVSFEESKMNQVKSDALIDVEALFESGKIWSETLPLLVGSSDNIKPPPKKNLIRRNIKQYSKNTSRIVSPSGSQNNRNIFQPKEVVKDFIRINIGKKSPLKNVTPKINGQIVRTTKKLNNQKRSTVTTTTEEHYQTEN